MPFYFSMGSTGPNVKRVQVMLNFLVNPSHHLVVDGIFGPKTRAEAVKFQQQAKLGPDGIVGPLTITALVSEVVKTCQLGQRRR